MRTWLWLLLTPVACGPSIQSLWEGEVRFEHCYRLDHDEQITGSHRLACWSNWLSLYSYGQSRDRVDHAQARLQTLQGGDGRTQGLEAEAPSPPELTGARATRSTPEDPTRSPPAIVRATSTSTATAAGPPGSSCIDACRKDWLRCSNGCPPTELTSSSPQCSGGCDRDYNDCANRCLTEAR
jgi:hypothetical protein